MTDKDFKEIERVKTLYTIASQALKLLAEETPIEDGEEIINVCFDFRFKLESAYNHYLFNKDTK